MPSGSWNWKRSILSYVKLTKMLSLQKGQKDSTVRSWHDAVHECDLRGATLASFHSEDECVAIVNAIGNDGHNLFIGLSSDGYSKLLTTELIVILCRQN